MLVELAKLSTNFVVENMKKDTLITIASFTELRPFTTMHPRISPILNFFYTMPKDYTTSLVMDDGVHRDGKIWHNLQTWGEVSRLQIET